MLKFKFYLIVCSILLTCMGNLYSQPYHYSTFKMDPSLRDSFPFTRNWSYRWDVLKGENGRLYNLYGSKISSEDKKRLYFTADCETNVQGGYKISYCFTQKNKADIELVFSDGLPAYASEFYVYIKKDSFYFRPKTVYPVKKKGTFSYEVEEQELILKQLHLDSKILFGYINVKFIEFYKEDGKETLKSYYYLRGNFKTPIFNYKKSRILKKT